MFFRLAWHEGSSSGGVAVSRVFFNAIGIPQQQGSMRAFVVRGRAVQTSDNKKLRPWRNIVHDAAVMAVGDRGLFQGPVEVRAEFRMPRPQSSPKTRETLPDKTPDLDKLIRGLLDALSGVVFDDDKRVVSLNVTERYTDRDGEQPGVSVTIEPLLVMP